ncbi:MAG: hypothetical protein J6333_07770 [Planctomycetes bacterium]|nr:hypothetical protein [Planctomycetota bacterium]
MRFHEALKLAREHTRVVRERRHLLYTFGATRLPYVCVTAGEGRVLLHDGEVTAEKPNILFPGRDFKLEGFDPDDDFPGAGEDGAAAMPVFIAREIRMPAGDYTNREHPLRTVAGTVEEALAREIARLDAAHDIRTGVIHAPEAVWRLGVLFYVGAQIARSAEANVAEQAERLRLRGS